MTKQIYLKGLFILFLALFSSKVLSAQTKGKKTQSKQVKLSKKKAKTPADSLQTIDLGAVNITATRLLFVSKKDTMTYNLNALTLKAGAMLGDALKKFPNMEIKEGKLFYQGQAVNRLLINGIDFARDDPSKALNTLPAYVVNKVKAFNQETEASRLAGYDDGSRDIVVDVLLKKKYLGSWTGEAEIGGGSKDYYLAKGFANTFTDRFRISLFGNANNVNQQLWYNGEGKTVNGYRGYYGVNEFLAPGATFFWKTKAQKGKKGYFIIEGDTDFDREEKFATETQEEEQYFDKSALYKANRRVYEPLEYRWAGHLRFEWCPTDDLVITYKPNLEIQKIKTDVSFLYAKWNENPFKNGESALDSLEQNTNVWSKKYQPVYLEQNPKKHYTNIMPAWHNLFIRQSLKSKGSISLSHNLSLRKHRSDVYEIDYYDFFNQGQKDKLINRYTADDHDRFRQNTKITFSQPIKDFRFNLSYDYSYGKELRDNDVYRLDLLNSLYQSYATAFNLLGELPENFEAMKTGIIDNEATIYEDKCTNIHTIDFELNYRKGGYFLNLNPWVAYRDESLDHHKGAYKPFHISRSEWLPELNLRAGFNSTKKGRLFFNYTHTIDQPNLYQSIDLPDLRDPQRINLPNPNLKNNSKHYFSIRYNKRFDGKIKGKKYQPTIFFNSRLFYSEDEISDKVAYNRKTAVTTTMPVNIGATYRLSSHLKTELPLDLKQRLFFSVGLSYAKNKSKNFAVVGSLDEAKLYDSEKDDYRVTLGPKLRLSKFNTSIRYGVHIAHYANTNILVKNSNTKEQFVDADLSWNLPLEINLSANLHYMHYSGSDDRVYQSDITNLDFSLDRAFLKDKSLTVFFRAVDVLNQNSGFFRYYNAEERTLRRGWSNNLGRYFMLGLKYRFSTAK